ncbi:hypothetical protein PENSPDRAFT_578022 [Peniophora sp. CONT]|nr:hypothetical protein PENSPDRAFT_578022 [Peniophora sp. CONT]
MPFLPAIISNASRSASTFVLLESSASQSCLSILSAIVSHEDPKSFVLLFCLLYPPSSLVDNPARLRSEQLQVHDRTALVPGYCDEEDDTLSALLGAIDAAPPGALTVIFDSADTLCADKQSASKAFSVFNAASAKLRARSSPSRLIVHINSPSPLLPLLTTTKMSPTLTHIVAHPPALLLHLATANLTPPPPSTPPERFWPAFSPLAARAWEVEKLIFGSDGPGLSEGRSEIVLEILVRGASASNEKRRGAERALKGWSRARGPCDLTDLESLRSVWTRHSAIEETVTANPAQNLSFNLDLTPNQQQARASVPLPYAHSGNTATPATPGAIYYDPDSADDIDDDDPDEDLDI